MFLGKSINILEIKVFISENSETETQQPLTAPCECGHVISVTCGEINDL